MVSDSFAFTDLPPARVQRVDRGLVTVLTEDGPLRVSLGADLLDQMAKDSTAGPCTGDWCLLRAWPDGPVTLESVLPRGPSIRRAEVGGSSREQVLAANIDVAAVVVGLIPEPVIGKLERMLALAWSSGAQPAVVLTKADLVPDAEQIAEDVRSAADGVPVIVVSSVTGQGIAEVRALAGADGTIALLGSSGTGKSSLVNALVGTEVLGTQRIRADGRGRHTSVRRELVLLPGGGAVIDTPGLRGVGLIDAEEGLASTFGDVEALVSQCRFRDCAHTSEPGCAVRAAVDDGTLSVRRLESWHKLREEMRVMAARQDERSRAELLKVWRRDSKAHRKPRGGAS
ncbi:MAG: ribosome small subunit-dependent GTPase A [Propionibacteriales bacterium]|nr:ribosome small subunit-dependent GTPase A [Propionibacteriales bacterium]